MATRKSQRVFIWVIAVVMTVGTLAGFVALVLAPESDKIQLAEDQAKQQKLLDEYTKQQENLPLPGYNTESFDPASASSLKVDTIIKGEGAVATPSSNVEANYFGWTSDGKIFDSSNKGGTITPVPFSLQGVIPGWTEGLTGVTAGSTVKLTIPVDKAYTATPNEKGDPVGPLMFIVEVKKIN
jgi:FKBP-type peptidyl-prolyl cis-trans isomerase